MSYGSNITLLQLGPFSKSFSDENVELPSSASSSSIRQQIKEEEKMGGRRIAYSECKSTGLYPAERKKERSFIKIPFPFLTRER